MKIEAYIEPVISLVVHDTDRFGNKTKTKTKFKSAHHAALHYSAYSSQKFAAKYRNTPSALWANERYGQRKERAYRRSLPIFKRMLKEKL
jgi:hypothetical protein